MAVMTRRAFLASVVGTLALPMVAEAQQAGSSEWSPGPQLGPGVSVRVIDENRERGSYTFHVRYPVGHTVGPHRHKSAEHVTVLSGTLLLGRGDVWDPAKLKEAVRILRDRVPDTEYPVGRRRPHGTRYTRGRLVGGDHGRYGWPYRRVHSQPCAAVARRPG